MKKFLIKHVGNMGDHVFFIPPILATLKEKHPGCHITLVTAWGYKDKRGWLASRSLGEGWGRRNQGGFCIHLMMTNPHVDQLVHYHDKKTSLDGKICTEDGQSFPTWSAGYFEEQKQSGKYDGVFELDFGLAYDDNPIQRMYQALEMPEENFTNYRIYVTQKDKEIAAETAKRFPEPAVALLEGLDSASTRGWDPGKVPKLASRIKAEYRVDPIWFGSRSIPEFEGRPLSLRENIATLQHVDAAIGVMSGPLHFAAAVGTPTLTLYADQPLHRAAPAFFLNKYIKDKARKHRTLLGPDRQPYTFLKSDKPDRNLTPAEIKAQGFKDWQDPGRQSTKTGLAAITVDEVMAVLNDMISL